MIDWILKLGFVAFLAAAAWTIYRERFVFEIRIADGQPRLRKGQVTANFLGRVADVCRDCRVSQGWIAGLRQGRHVLLRFSGTFPAELQQRLRNEWQVTG